MKQENPSSNELNRKIEDPLRPKYHFIPKSNWMNDPNGPIFYKGEYHIFYQYNPNGPQWGTIHWGHAKSKDLVHWEHLPIALKPSIEKGETDCFSGSCVINKDIPTIIYTSIGKERPPSTGAEQWLAYGDSNLISWKKFEKNPIMTSSIHKGLEIEDWRDPFIWKEKNNWYLILGGHIKNPRQPVVLLYKSEDLIHWDFLNPLLIGEKASGKNWECPNLFKLRQKRLLIVSPHNKVLYSIGEYIHYQFYPTQWNILDHGKIYYATNGIQDSENRVILWAWVKARGEDYWNGCLSLPRILSLSQDNKLGYTFPSELRKLREQEYILKNQVLSNQSLQYPYNKENFCFEIQVEIEVLDAQGLYFKFNDIIEFTKSETIGYDCVEHIFWAGKDKINNFKLNKNQLLKIHLFIDMSIVEIIINNEYCITTQITSQKPKLGKIELMANSGKIRVKKFAIWHLKSIW